MLRDIRAVHVTVTHDDDDDDVCDALLDYTPNISEVTHSVSS